MHGKHIFFGTFILLQLVYENQFCPNVSSPIFNGRDGHVLKAWGNASPVLWKEIGPLKSALITHPFGYNGYLPGFFGPLHDALGETRHLVPACFASISDGYVSRGTYPGTQTSMNARREIIRETTFTHHLSSFII
jgi:hypothetical protein